MCALARAVLLALAPVVLADAGGPRRALGVHRLVHLPLVEVVEVQGVRADKLAQLVRRVRLLAHLRAVLARQLPVEDVQRVVVHVRQLLAVHVRVAEQPARLPHAAHEHAAHHRPPHRRLEVPRRLVPPRVLLHDRRQVAQRHVQLRLRVHVHLLGRQPLRPDPVVVRLHHDLVRQLRRDLVPHREQQLHDVPRQARLVVGRQARVVVLLRVDPPEQQRVVPVVVPLVLPEELPHRRHVQLRPPRRVQRRPHHVVPGLLRLRDPRLVLRALHPVHLPVRRVHRRLADAQLVRRLVPHRDRRVPRRRPHRPPEHRVQPVQPHHPEEVPGVDQRRVHRQRVRLRTLRHLRLDLRVLRHERHVRLHRQLVRVPPDLRLQEQLRRRQRVVRRLHLVVDEREHPDPLRRHVVLHRLLLRVSQLPRELVRRPQVRDLQEPQPLHRQQDVEVPHRQDVALRPGDLHRHLRLVRVVRRRRRVLRAVLVRPRRRLARRQDVRLLVRDEPEVRVLLRTEGVRSRLPLPVDLLVVLLRGGVRHLDELLGVRRLAQTRQVVLQLAHVKTRRLPEPRVDAVHRLDVLQLVPRPRRHALHHAQTHLRDAQHTADVLAALRHPVLEPLLRRVPHRLADARRRGRAQRRRQHCAGKHPHRVCVFLSFLRLNEVQIL
eukprot:Rhum_TRINITY_DN14037_c0_g1::Rhum_TRINITY_DN14037_c0_g1_i3::g.68343::m.68343